MLNIHRCGVENCAVCFVEVLLCNLCARFQVHFNRWFSLDVIAAMLVYRTIEKNSFGKLTLLLCKIRAIICYCFVHQHGRLIA